MALEELRVWVEGTERVIRGVDENTTSENVMVALASAIGKSGKFALLEKWRDFERILPRNGKPLKCLRMWGVQSGEVKFVLKDDLENDSLRRDLRSAVMDPLKHETIDSLPQDLLQMSFQQNSLESIQSIQTRKVDRLARDLEILKFYHECFSCNGNEKNKLNSTSEELWDDFPMKFCHVIKLQSNELSEKETWEKELERQQNLNLRLVSELESQQNKVHLTRIHASDLDAVSEKLYSLLLQNSQNRDAKTDNGNVEASQAEKNPQEFKFDLETQQEIARLKQQLLVQTELAATQRGELERVTGSIEEVDRTLQEKQNELKLLRQELDNDATYYDLDENFDSDQIEDSSMTFEPESEKLNLNKAKINTKEPAIALLARYGQRKYLSPPRANHKRHNSRAASKLDATMETEGVYV